MVSKELNNPSRSELITNFVKTNPEYYIEKFQQIGSKPTFSLSFNLVCCNSWTNLVWNEKYLELGFDFFNY